MPSVVVIARARASAGSRAEERPDGRTAIKTAIIYYLALCNLFICSLCGGARARATIKTPVKGDFSSDGTRCGGGLIAEIQTCARERARRSIISSLCRKRASDKLSLVVLAPVSHRIRRTRRRRALKSPAAPRTIRRGKIADAAIFTRPPFFLLSIAREISARGPLARAFPQRFCSTMRRVQIEQKKKTTKRRDSSLRYKVDEEIGK